MTEETTRIRNEAVKAALEAHGKVRGFRSVYTSFAIKELICDLARMLRDDGKDIQCALAQRGLIDRHAYESQYCGLPNAASQLVYLWLFRNPPSRDRWLEIASSIFNDACKLPAASHYHESCQEIATRRLAAKIREEVTTRQSLPSQGLLERSGYESGKVVYWYEVAALLLDQAIVPYDL